jgi:CheY-like chemotaxis protein
MASFEVPKTAILDLSDGRRVPVRISGLARSGLWVEAGGPIEVPFRSTVRVSFPSESGAIGAVTEVVQSSGACIGLELACGADDLLRKVFEDWSEGRGSTLYLAARKRPATPPPQAPPPSDETADLSRERERKKARLKGLSVLVVEDDCRVARLLQAGLSRFGGRVHVAQDGLAAIDILKARHIDAMLLDWILPHMDGARVLDEARRLKPNLAVAVVSGMMHSATMRSEVRKLGADEVFSKPFELKQISDWIAGQPGA